MPGPEVAAVTPIVNRCVLIPGTGSWADDGRVDWYCDGSPFVAFLREQRIEPVFGDGRPFTWSTRLGGIGWGNADLLEWNAAGYNLYGYCVPPLCPDQRIPPAETNLIAHSHGLQVVLFAAAHGLRVNRLISIGSPVRKDMMPFAEKARPNIAQWTHVYSDASDRWQWFGELFDGKFGVVRQHPLADRNDFVPQVGHSELLRDPKHFHFWAERHWLAPTG